MEDCEPPTSFSKTDFSVESVFLGMICIQSGGLMSLPSDVNIEVWSKVQFAFAEALGFDEEEIEFGSKIVDHDDKLGSTIAIFQIRNNLRFELGMVCFFIFGPDERSFRPKIL